MLANTHKRKRDILCSHSKILQELEDYKRSAKEECTSVSRTSKWLSFTAKRSHCTAETARRNWKKPASDVWSALESFPVQNAIPEALTKIKILQQDRLIILPVQEVYLLPVEEEKHRILLAQEVDFLREEEASMDRISPAQEVEFLLEEASIHIIDQISSQQFYFLEQTVAVDSDLEGLAVFLQDVRFRHRLDPCRNKAV